MKLVSAWLSAAIMFWAACAALGGECQAQPREAEAASSPAPGPAALTGFSLPQASYRNDYDALQSSLIWRGAAERSGLSFGVNQSSRAFFLPEEADGRVFGVQRDTPVEVTVATRTIIPTLQVGVAQRTSLDDGDAKLGGREFRLGALGVGEFKSPTWDNPQWYVFAAADDGALTWTPRARAEGVTALRVQEERLMIGDFQAGLTLEANGLQASLSYIQRDVSMAGKSEDASFTGLALTYRR